MSDLKLFYGPYEAHGVIRHKTQRLHGLLDCLNQENYSVEIIPSPHLNRLTIELKDREIFTCDIRFLLFNLPCDEDIVCQRILKVIKDHEALFNVDTNIPKFASINEGMRWVKTQKMLTAKELLSSDLSLLYEIGNPNNSLQTVTMEAATPSQAQVAKSDDFPFMHYFDKSCPEDFQYTDMPQYYAFDFDMCAKDYLSTVQEIEEEEEAVEKKSSDDVCRCLEYDPPTPPTVCYGPCFDQCPPSYLTSTSETEPISNSGTFNYGTQVSLPQSGIYNYGTNVSLPQGGTYNYYGTNVSLPQGGPYNYYGTNVSLPQGSTYNYYGAGAPLPQASTYNYYGTNASLPQGGTYNYGTDASLAQEGNRLNNTEVTLASYWGDH